MRRSRWIAWMLTLMAGPTLATAAHAAGPQCTTADKSSWLPPAQVKSMLQQHGFTNIGVIKASDGNCYVVQANDQTGAKKTLYLNPTDGALMGME
ncbi:MAG: PepSY domain-containing protein [Dongiaceae bacterium]